MAQIEIHEITTLTYDPSGGTHIGDPTLFEEQVEIGRSSKNEWVDLQPDAIDTLAFNAIHHFRNRDVTKPVPRGFRLSD